MNVVDAFEAATASYFAGKTPKPRRRRRALDASLDSGSDENDEDKENDAQPLSVPLDAVRTALLTAGERLAQVCLCARGHPAYTRICAQPYISLQSHFIHTHFSSMLVTLFAGHNCLLYGVGEKTTILDAFERQLDAKCCTHMRVDAYTNNVNAKVILQQLIMHTANAPADCLASQQIMQMAHAFVADAQKAPQRDVILIIDGLDAPSLRDPSAQEALAVVCSAATNVQLVATVDHYNASVLWPAPRFARYAFAYFDATTYACYAQHLLTGESRLLGIASANGGAQHTLQSLDSVWTSLTTNARRTLAKLVQCAAEPTDAVGDRAVTFWQLFRVCRDEFIVSSEVQLRQLLVEFADHHLVRTVRHEDVGEAIAVTVPLPLITQFFEHH